MYVLCNVFSVIDEKKPNTGTKLKMKYWKFFKFVWYTITFILIIKFTVIAMDWLLIILLVLFCLLLVTKFMKPIEETIRNHSLFHKFDHCLLWVNYLEYLLRYISHYYWQFTLKYTGISQEVTVMWKMVKSNLFNLI